MNRLEEIERDSSKDAVRFDEREVESPGDRRKDREGKEGDANLLMVRAVLVVAQRLGLALDDGLVFDVRVCRILLELVGETRDPAPEEPNDVLKDPERTDDGSVDSSEEERDEHKGAEDGEGARKEGRNELQLREKREFVRNFLSEIDEVGDKSAEYDDREEYAADAQDVVFDHNRFLSERARKRALMTKRRANSNGVSVQNKENAPPREAGTHCMSVQTATQILMR